MRTNVESSLEVQTSQLGTAYSNARGAVDQLLYLLALVPELPLRLGLLPDVLTHGDGLDGSEVRPVDLGVAGTGVELVQQTVAVKIPVANITNTVFVLIELIGIGNERAIVIVVHHSVIVGIRITVVTNSVIIAVSLIGIRNIRTVVKAVRNPIKISIISLVTGVTYQVIIVILLAWVEVLETIIADVTHVVFVKVGLISVRDLRTVIVSILDTVIVNVRITGVAQLIIVHIFLAFVAEPRAVVTDIPHTVIILVSLVDVDVKRTVVDIIEDAVTISVLIAVVTNSVLVLVLLARVRLAHTVVLPAGWIRAVQRDVGPTVRVIVWAAVSAGPRPALIADTLLATGPTSGLNECGLAVTGG